MQSSPRGGASRNSFSSNVLLQAFISSDSFPYTFFTLLHFSRLILEREREKLRINSNFRSLNFLQISGHLGSHMIEINWRKIHFEVSWKEKKISMLFSDARNFHPWTWTKVNNQNSDGSYGSSQEDVFVNGSKQVLCADYSRWDCFLKYVQSVL